MATMPDSRANQHDNADQKDSHVGADYGLAQGPDRGSDPSEDEKPKQYPLQRAPPPYGERRSLNQAEDNDGRCEEQDRFHNQNPLEIERNCEANEGFGSDNHAEERCPRDRGAGCWHKIAVAAINAALERSPSAIETLSLPGKLSERASATQLWRSYCLS